jgi:DNA-binding IscR family transcriptional regulator
MGGIQAVDTEISVYDVIHALHEDFSLVPCISGKTCESVHICEMSSIFHRMNRSLESLMKLTKL